MEQTGQQRNETPQETSEKVTRSYFRIGSDDLSRERAIYQYLIGAVQLAVMVPLLFYIRFGDVGPIGWGVTVFFVAYVLLVALGLYFQPRTEYHTPVVAKKNWSDKIGAWWLMACAFGPLIGWFATSGTIPITTGSWRWLFGIRFFSTIMLPILCAVPLVRYVRGKSTLIALPLLVMITLLPVTTGVNSALDFWQGPKLTPIGGRSYLILSHTEKVVAQ